MQIVAGIVTWCVLGTVMAQGTQGTWRPQADLRARGEALAYDPVRRRVVLFGGGGNYFANTSQFAYSDETWEWDGGRWELMRPNTSPAPRNGHSIAYDHVSRRTILFGGANGKQHFSDTWAWDGQDWRLLKPKNAPQARYLHSVASDPLRKRMVLFGGAQGFFLSNLNPLQDTWEWNGINWIQMKPKTVPETRCSGGIAFCSLSKSLVLFGGQRDLFKQAPPRVTWEWNGSDWKKHASAPKSAATGPLVAIPVSGKVLLLWGQTQSKMEYNEWDGKSWTGSLRQTPFWKSEASGIVADETSKELLMLGSGSPRKPITWSYDGKAWKKRAEWIVPSSLGQVVHDPSRDETLVIATEIQSPTITTWLLSQGTFKRLHPKKAPSLRDRTVAVYHSGLKRVWVFGGRTRTGYARDLWLWDGSDWKQSASVNGPTTQDVTAYAYDSVREMVVVFMARTQTTWEWDVKAGWTKHLTRGIPKDRYQLAMAYDPLRKKVVMAGPESSATRSFNTYEWTGKDWIEIKTANKPAPRLRHLMGFVPRLGGIVLCGGFARKAYHDTWVFDGKDWSEVKAVPYKADSRGLDYFISGSYNVNRQRFVAIRYSQSVLPRVSELVFDDLRLSQPYPRPGEKVLFNAAIPSHGQLPILFMLSGSTRPGIPLRQIPNYGVEYVPLAPDGLFWASLGLGLVSLLDKQGKSSIPITIPNVSAMIGVRFSAAGVVIRPGVGFMHITNSAEVQVVR